MGATIITGLPVLSQLGSTVLASSSPNLTNSRLTGMTGFGPSSESFLKAYLYTDDTSSRSGIGELFNNVNILTRAVKTTAVVGTAETLPKRFQEFWTSPEPLPAAVLAGLCLYEQGGEFYWSEGEALLKACGALACSGTEFKRQVEVLVMEWALLETRLIGEPMEETQPKDSLGKEKITPESRWLSYLRREIESEPQSPRPKASEVWQSQPFQILKELRQMQARRGSLPRALNPRSIEIEGLLRTGMDEALGTRSEIDEASVSKLVRTLARKLVRSAVAGKLSDREVRMIGGCLGHDLINLRSLGENEVSLSKRVVERGLPKLSAAGLIGIIRYIDDLLQEHEEVGEIAKTIAHAAFPAADPAKRAQLLIKRWKIAYQVATQELDELEEAGDIANMIANAAFGAADSTKRARLLVKRWKIAYDAAKQKLGGVEEVGEIAKTIAGVAFPATDSARQARLLVKGWKIAYEAAQQELDELEAAGDIAKTITHEAFEATDPAKRAQLLVKRWKIAYDAAEQELGKLEEAGDIAKMIANVAFQATDSAKRARVLVKRWKHSHEVAKQELDELEEAGDIAKTIAGEAFRATDSAKQARVLVKRWKIAYDVAKQELDELEEAGDIAKMIAIEACMATDSAKQTQLLIKRWKIAYDAAKQELGKIKEAGDIAKTIANVACPATDPAKQAQLLVKRWKIAYDAAKQELGKTKEARKIANSIANVAFTARDPAQRARELVRQSIHLQSSYEGE